MITGFNTDVEHDGVVYHVQTEDKGLETPLLLSLVYSGGAILASKRSSYQDLIRAGFNEAALAERLQRQHRLICAAINAGRIEDLKKMNAPPRSAEVTGTVTIPQPPAEARSLELPHEQQPAKQPFEQPFVDSRAPLQPSPQRPSPYTVYDSRRHATPEEVADAEAGLRISLHGEKDFRGGDNIEMEVIVTRVSAEGEQPVAAVVSVKILGTAFRPVILSLKTNRQGSVGLSSRIPSFKTGRAAIVIKASAAGSTTEIRRVIHPG